VGRAVRAGPRAVRAGPRPADKKRGAE